MTEDKKAKKVIFTSPVKNVGHRFKVDGVRFLVKFDGTAKVLDADEDKDLIAAMRAHIEASKEVNAYPFREFDEAAAKKAAASKIAESEAAFAARQALGAQNPDVNPAELDKVAGTATSPQFNFGNK